MPRLDNSDPDTILCFGLLPGELVDLCLECYLREQWDQDVAHPPYEDENYTCHICGCKLGDQDE